MTIKLLAGNPCQSALVFLTKDELFHMGIIPRSLTLQNKKNRLLLEGIFDLLRELAGLRRDGNYAYVICRPLRNGNCRLFIQFTHEPSGRLFAFAGADDLLDAVNQLRRRKELDLSEVRIDHSGGNYQIYIPSGLKISKNALAILSEYSV